MSEAAQKLLEQIRALPDADQRFIADCLWVPCPRDAHPLDDLEPESELPLGAEPVERDPHDWFHERRQPDDPLLMSDPPPSTLALELWTRVAELDADGQQVIADEVYRDVGYGYDLEAEDPEQWAEILRRMESVANGTAVLLDADAVFEEVRRRLEERRRIAATGTMPTDP